MKHVRNIGSSAARAAVMTDHVPTLIALAVNHAAEPTISADADGGTRA